jgi:hypothetical protein
MKNLIDAAIRNLSTNSSSTADYLHQITIYIHICHHHRPSFFNRLIAAISAAQVDLVYPALFSGNSRGYLNPHLFARPDRVDPADCFVEVSGWVF